MRQSWAAAVKTGYRSAKADKAVLTSTARIRRSNRTEVTLALNSKAIKDSAGAFATLEDKGRRISGFYNCLCNTAGVIRMFAGDSNCLTHKVINTPVSTG